MPLRGSAYPLSCRVARQTAGLFTFFVIPLIPYYTFRCLIFRVSSCTLTCSRHLSMHRSAYPSDGRPQSLSGIMSDWLCVSFSASLPCCMHLHAHTGQAMSLGRTGSCTPQTAGQTRSAPGRPSESDWHPTTASFFYLVTASSMRST